MTTRPLIAIPGMRTPQVRGLRREGYVVAQRVADSVLRAGGEPLMLSPGASPAATSRLAVFDGVLVPGGRDIDPSLYTADGRHERTDEPDAAQDAHDLEVTRAAVTMQLPLLAICRGMQMLNVALGGTLIQHLPEDGIHRDGLHTVDLDEGTAVSRAMGSTTVVVSSYHHQAVDRVGAGLRVTGRATDGCIEVLEHESAPVLAVQWHPEDDADTNASDQALFDRLVDLAGSRRGARKVLA